MTTNFFVFCSSKIHIAIEEEETKIEVCITNESYVKNLTSLTGKLRYRLVLRTFTYASASEMRLFII